MMMFHKAKAPAPQGKVDPTPVGNGRGDTEGWAHNIPDPSGVESE